ncbi:hypothetical protein [Streptomyces sp. S1D4-20]|uniref:hypothetical protein n=1 Tax=Streptomyces sp. S1D4-20 TaxID=2594462 RepID=UPI0011634042|nr:hypothetical protein [Streptomyces sp. S1D4-20]QDN54135.1 hypothetical protein FNV67_00720 [Streptomyces sp. S1D4-20]
MRGLGPRRQFAHLGLLAALQLVHRRLNGFEAVGHHGPQTGDPLGHGLAFSRLLLLYRLHVGYSVPVHRIGRRSGHPPGHNEHPSTARGGNRPHQQPRSGPRGLRPQEVFRQRYQQQHDARGEDGELPEP